MWRFAMMLVLPGCGLLFGSDPALDGALDGGLDGAIFEGGLADIGDMDAPIVDAAVSDGIVPSDAFTDVSTTDSGPAFLPTITRGFFEFGAAVVPAAMGVEQSDPQPFRVGRVKLITSMTMDLGLIDASIQGRSGVVPVNPRYMDIGTETAIALDVMGEPLPDGFYCLRIAATPSTAGPLLDGEWRSAFPSGDMSEGGDFVYAFSVLAGDVNGDGVVDDVDGDAIVDARGTMMPRADLDGSGTVDVLDARLWTGLRGNNLGGFAPIACDIAGL